VNKVGPYNNPQETYNYYYLPYCKPRPEQRDEHAWGGLGEVLQGNELINSQLDLKFKGAHHAVPWKYCSDCVRVFVWGRD
jgi:transmembrane 9 superfamily member 3